MPARYTTLVRDVCEYYAEMGIEDKGGINEVLNRSWNKLFTTNWEIFDESYRRILCTKILRKYFTREICAETVALWKLWMDATLCEIMPTYNQLYETTLIKYDLFNNVDVTTTFEKSGSEKNKNSGTSKTTDSASSSDSATLKGTTKNTSNGKSTIDGTDWNLHSDTPQGGIKGVDDGDYLSDATKTTTDNTTTTSGTDSTTSSNETSSSHTISTTQNVTNNDSGSKETAEEWTQRIFGKNNGNTNASLIKEFRENILNIDQMIMRDLEPLFFQLW